MSQSCCVHCCRVVLISVMIWSLPNCALARIEG